MLLHGRLKKLYRACDSKIPLTVAAQRWIFTNFQLIKYVKCQYNNTPGGKYHYLLERARIFDKRVEKL